MARKVSSGSSRDIRRQLLADYYQPVTLNPKVPLADYFDYLKALYRDAMRTLKFEHLIQDSYVKLTQFAHIATEVIPFHAQYKNLLFLTSINWMRKTLREVVEILEAIVAKMDADEDKRMDDLLFNEFDDTNKEEEESLQRAIALSSEDEVKGVKSNREMEEEVNKVVLESIHQQDTNGEEPIAPPPLFSSSPIASSSLSASLGGEENPSLGGHYPCLPPPVDNGSHMKEEYVSGKYRSPHKHTNSSRYLFFTIVPAFLFFSLFFTDHLLCFIVL